MSDAMGAAALIGGTIIIISGFLLLALLTRPALLSEADFFYWDCASAWTQDEAVAHESRPDLVSADESTDQAIEIKDLKSKLATALESAKCAELKASKAEKRAAESAESAKTALEDERQKRLETLPRANSLELGLFRSTSRLILRADRRSNFVLGKVINWILFGFEAWVLWSHGAEIISFLLPPDYSTILAPYTLQLQALSWIAFLVYAFRHTDANDVIQGLYQEKAHLQKQVNVHYRREKQAWHVFNETNDQLQSSQKWRLKAENSLKETEEAFEMFREERPLNPYKMKIAGLPNMMLRDIIADITKREYQLQKQEQQKDEKISNEKIMAAVVQDTLEEELRARMYDLAWTNQSFSWLYDWYYQQADRLFRVQAHVKRRANDIETLNEELGVAQEELEKATEELGQAKEELGTVTKKLNQTTEDLQKAQKVLNETNEKLSEANDDLFEAKGELAKKRTTISGLQDDIENFMIAYDLSWEDAHYIMDKRRLPPTLKRPQTPPTSLQLSNGGAQPASAAVVQSSSVEEDEEKPLFDPRWKEVVGKDTYQAPGPAPAPTRQFSYGTIRTQPDVNPFTEPPPLLPEFTLKPAAERKRTQSSSGEHLVDFSSSPDEDGSTKEQPQEMSKRGKKREKQRAAQNRVAREYPEDVLAQPDIESPTTSHGKEKAANQRRMKAIAEEVVQNRAT